MEYERDKRVQKPLPQPIENVLFERVDGRIIHLTENESIIQNILATETSPENPISRRGLARARFAKLNSTAPSNLPDQPSIEAITGVQKKFPANVMTITKGKNAGYLFWQETP